MQNDTIMQSVETASFNLALAQLVWDSRILQPAIEKAGSPQDLWEAPERALAQWLGDSDRAKKLVKLRQSIEPDSLPARYEQANIQCLHIDDPLYPALLKQICDPPFMLYVRGGRLEMLSKTLAIVGTRQYSDYGQRATEKLVAELSPYQATIVSGLAAGIDTIAHQAALNCGLNTVAVFGTGINQYYPRGNERLAHAILDAGGSLVSEYPLDYPSGAYMFPRRNRIIAGLSQGTLIVEGNIKSGSLITARLALEENRQVMAVPGSILSPTSQGPNRLIQDGAPPITCGLDIAHAMQWHTPLIQQQHHEEGTQLSLPSAVSSRSSSQKQIDLPADQRAVLLAIGHDATSFDAIHARQPSMSVMELNTILTMLELQGLITALPGENFCRI